MSLVVFDSVDGLKNDILQGTVAKGMKVRSVVIDEDGQRTEGAWDSVQNFAVANNAFRSLYRPVWHCTVKFLAYGAIVGCALKAMDTTVTFFRMAPILGVVWLVVLGSLLVAHKWPLAPLAAMAASFYILDNHTNFFAAVFATMLVGAGFGAPTGMAIGTVVGRLRKGRTRIAPDAVSEGYRPYLLGLVLPLAFLAVAIPCYVWLNMRIYEWMS